MTRADKLQRFLDEEGEKIACVEAIIKRRDGRWFGILNPLYWRDQDELNRVVSTFRLCDRNYNFRLPDLDEIV